MTSGMEEPVTYPYLEQAPLRSFRVDPIPLEPGWEPRIEDGGRMSKDWLFEWRTKIEQAVVERNPWGLVVMTPGGQLELYDVTMDRIRDSAMFGIKVWLLFPSAHENPIPIPKGYEREKDK